MRRALSVVVAGVALMGVAACGILGDSPDSSAGAASLTPEQAATKASCEAIGEVYTNNMGAFASSLSKVPTSGDVARKDARQKLGEFGTAVLGATKSSADTQLRTAGQEAAEHLQATAKDAKFFAKIKTTQDVSTVLGPTMKQWLAPVTNHCS